MRITKRMTLVTLFFILLTSIAGAQSIPQSDQP